MPAVVTAAANTTCPECNHEVSKLAFICDGCGFPLVGTPISQGAEVPREEPVSSAVPLWKKPWAIIGGILLFGFLASVTLPGPKPVEQQSETESTDPATESTTAPEEQEAEANTDEAEQTNTAEVKEEKPLSLDSITFRVVEKNQYFWKIAYKINISNKTSEDISGNVVVNLLDKDGFILDRDMNYNQVIRPLGTTSITGVDMVLSLIHI